MTAPAFPDIVPSRGSQADVRTRLVKASFGDGYVQAAADGLNPLEKSYRFELRAAPEAELDTVLEFLEARGGHEPFTFQPYGYAAAVKWRCEQWTEIDWISPTHGNLSATFVRDFTP